MEICSNNGCETRVCSLRHPKSCRYFHEMQYCKFGEWCLFNHENGKGFGINTALEKVDSKIVILENESKKLRENLAEKDATIKNVEEKLDVLEKKLEDVTTEMEYCASAACMLAEEIWQIAEGFVEVTVIFHILKITVQVYH